MLGAAMVREAMSAKPDWKSPGYGYGFEVEEGGRILGHGGSFVGAQAKLDMYPEGDFTSIVLSNYSQGARATVMRIRELMLAGKVK